MRLLSTMTITACLLAAHGAANAGLSGQTVQLEWIYAPNGFHSTTSVVVGPGPEISESWVASGGTVDINDRTIYVAFLDDFHGVTGIGADVVWRFTADLTAFSGFTAATNFVGWQDSWVTLTSGAMTIDYANAVTMPRSQGFIEVILIPVPEPSVTSLLLAGLLVVAALAPKGKHTTLLGAQRGA